MTAVLNVLVNFNGTNGSSPYGALMADANGDLFGTTENGGAYGDGTVFEIAKTAAGYLSAPITLVSFDGANGSNPYAGLIADADGNLFGTTAWGGTSNGGTVFEVVKTAVGYASTPTTLVNLKAPPYGGLITDAAGDLFGTAYGSVFEIAKTVTGYASAATPLASIAIFSISGLIADTDGNLFGTILGGAFIPHVPFDYGAVFEIAKTTIGYSSTPIILARFNGFNGQAPGSSLIADANGDLFGTTEQGGAYGYGTVFEIARTAGGYASIPTTLVNFDGTNGSFPLGTLIADANGNLFGTTAWGGTNNDGTLFEIAKTARGYSSVPTTLVNFDGTNGSNPNGSLIADAVGNYYGTAGKGGANNDGTVFEISNSGSVVPIVNPPAPNDFSGNGVSDILLRDPVSGNLSQFIMNNGQPIFSYVGMADPRLQVVGTGDFNGDGTSDILLRDPTSGNLSQFAMHSGQPTFAYVGMADPHLQVVGTGDFNGDGTTDILFRDPTSGALSQFIMLAGQPVFAYIGTTDPRLQVAGIGDFNGDGTNDILFRDPTSGDLGDFVMHNCQPTWTSIGWADPHLQVAGIGDYNGDGTADILFRDPTGGGIGMFAMHNNQPTWTPIGWAAPALQVTA